MSRIFRLDGDKVIYSDKQGMISKQGDVTLLTSHERYKTSDKIFDADKYTMYRIGGYQQYCAGVRTYNLTEIDGTPTDIDKQIKRIDKIEAGITNDRQEIQAGADNVNHPAHYETGKFECIDVMIETQGVEAVKDFCVCNAFKYLYRHGRKNGAEDIKKAIWYLDKWVELDDNSRAEKAVK